MNIADASLSCLLSMTGCEPIDPPSLLALGGHEALLDQLIERSAQRLRMDLFAYATMDIDPARVREPLWVLQDQRSQPMGDRL